MRLDAVADHHVIGLEGQAVEVDGKALGRAAHHDGFHARADRDSRPNASVMPYDSSSRRCPSAVPPPWLPMAGTTNGSAPRPSRCSTIARVIAAMLAMPRLPAVTATLCPGRTLSAQVQPRKLRLDLGRHVVDAGGVERLADAEDLGKSDHIGTWLAN